MKKRILATLLTAAMTISLLAGCGKSEAPAAGAAPVDNSAATGSVAPAADGEVEEITWMFWDDLNATEDLISKGYADVINRYNEQYAGKYHVTPVTTNLEEYYPKLNALVAAGPDKVPDVFIVSPGANLSDYATTGITASMNEALADGWKDTFTGDAVFSPMTYGEDIMAVPLNLAAACCFYNTEMFEKAGAKVPTNWAEMLETCEKLQAAGFTPITISAATPWCLSMVGGYLCESKGVNLSALADGSASWEDGKLEAAATDLVELSKYFQKTAAGDTNDVATANFYNEEAAILIQGSWAIGQINGENPDFESKCGVFQFPGVERIIAKSDSLAMSASTKHPEAAIALMKMFTDDTAQKYTAEVGGKIPVTKVEYDANVAPQQLAYVMDVFGKAKGTFGFYNESLPTSEAGSFFDDQLVAVFLGDMTPAEAATAIEEYYADKLR